MIVAMAVYVTKFRNINFVELGLFFISSAACSVFMGYGGSCCGKDGHKFSLEDERFVVMDTTSVVEKKDIVDLFLL